MKHLHSISLPKLAAQTKADTAPPSGGVGLLDVFTGAFDLILLALTFKFQDAGTPAD